MVTAPSHITSSCKNTIYNTCQTKRAYLGRPLGLLVFVRPDAIEMDLMQNYLKLFKIINFKGAGGPMFKTCQCAPYIAVMTISEFEPHSRFHS